MLTILAWIVIVIGLILFPMPAPVGIFFIVAGLTLLLSVDPKARSVLTKLRLRYQWIDDIIHKATERSPGRIKKVLLRTRIERRIHPLPTPVSHHKNKTTH